MSVFVQFAILGLGTGALYAFSAQGLVLIYRASGVVNFANGAVGFGAAYIFWELHSQDNWPFFPAFLVAVAAAFAFGALFFGLVMRRLRNRSGIVRIVATLGLLVAIQGIAANIYAQSDYVVPSSLPISVWHLTSRISLTSDRVYILIIVLAITTSLWALYRYTVFGLATNAVAENTRAAASLGWSADVVEGLNWGFGFALTATAAIFLVPIITLSVANMTSLLLVTLAAALVGNFRSFWATMGAGLAIGVIEGELNFYSQNWGDWSAGLATSVPFFLIVIVLVVRGRSLPLRDFFQQRNPRVGSGRIRPIAAGLTLVAAAIVAALLNATWASAFAATAAAAIILLSLVVIIGYAGQLSFAQAAFAGFGTYVAAEAAANAHLPFLLAALLGVAATIPLGIVFALPAVRTRGINLAIVTLGLGSALEFMLFDNAVYTGGVTGLSTGNPSIFGLNISASTYPERWAIFCLVVLALVMVMVANVRRGRTGRRLLAVRGNERAAAALGISVWSSKLYAFALAAGIAALGGILTYFSEPFVVMSSISNSASSGYIVNAVIGGVGFIAGPLVGATLSPGTIGTLIGNDILGQTISGYLATFSGVLVILVVVQNPDGVVADAMELLLRVLRRIPVASRLYLSRERSSSLPTERMRERVAPRALEVRDVTVRYGAVTACESISLDVEPGRVVGLIGPNGAGKTSLIDAITGFARTSSGSILIDGVDVTKLGASARARLGVSRTFQSLELYEDMTVIDNLRVAFEPRDRTATVTDLVWPRVPEVPPAAAAAMEEFGLEESLDRMVGSLPYGERRLLAAARAVASSPSILLLDECAAGLSESETRHLSLLVRRLADDWGMGVLVIEHDVSFVMSICDDVVVLDFGHKIAHGAPAAVREDPDVIAAYLGVPEPEMQR